MWIDFGGRRTVLPPGEYNGKNRQIMVIALPSLTVLPASLIALFSLVHDHTPREITTICRTPEIQLRDLGECCEPQSRLNPLPPWDVTRHGLGVA